MGPKFRDPASKQIASWTLPFLSLGALRPPSTPDAPPPTTAKAIKTEPAQIRCKNIYSSGSGLKIRDGREPARWSPGYLRWQSEGSGPSTCLAGRWVWIGPRHPHAALEPPQRAGGRLASCKVLGVPNSGLEHVQRTFPFPQMAEPDQKLLQAAEEGSQLSDKRVPLFGTNATHRCSWHPEPHRSPLLASHQKETETGESPSLREFSRLCQHRTFFMPDLEAGGKDLWVGANDLPIPTLAGGRSISIWTSGTNGLPLISSPLRKQGRFLP